MNVLLSIKPKYAEAILSGRKRHEFRRVIFRRSDINNVYLYANSTVKKVVGSFQIDGILEGSPEDIWERCHEHGGILRKDYFEYFEGSRKAYAIGVKNAVRFEQPLDPLTDVRGFTAPQSFSYVPDLEAI